MLEKPDLPENKIVACLQAEYGLHVVQVAFLPLGGDPNAAVYRVVAENERLYFLKLRSGVFDETAVALPKLLSDHGIGQIIAPLASQTGQLWANLEAFKLILYPFVEGHNGYEVDLADHNWRDFGAALKNIHTAVVPPALKQRIQQETYSPLWREIVKTFLVRIETEVFPDPVAAKVAALLQSHRAQVLDLVARAERLAQLLQARSPELIVCHADLHAGNILIDTHGAFYIVDWDNPILAPKERDLMFVGGGQFGAKRTAQAEETLFYQGYGPAQLDPNALAYYRYERIIQDIAAYCEQLLLTTAGGEDREQSLHYLTSNFLPNSVLAIAYNADKTRPQLTIAS